MFIRHAPPRRTSPPAAILSILLIPVFFPALHLAQDDPAPQADSQEASLADLQRQIRELQHLLQRLTEDSATEREALRRRIRELEEQLRLAERGRADDELQDILEDARAATAGEAEEEEGVEATRRTAAGRQRSLQALNPEISFLGDFSYDWTDGAIRDQFLLRAVEIAFQAPLDPYTRFKGFLSGHQEPPQLDFSGMADDPEDHVHVEIEEAYMEWVALPLGTSVAVGKFRQQFGTLNRWHEHSLPSTDTPFALRNIFGGEGLEGVGIHAAWRLPATRLYSNNLVVEITNGDNDVAFAGGAFRDPSYLLRYNGFFDLGPDTYFDFGLNGMTGPNDENNDGRTRIASVDVNFVWEPARRARYRTVELRGEYVYTRFEDVDATAGTEETFESTSFYTYLVWKFSRRWSVGARYDDAELPVPRVVLGGGPFSEGLRERAITPMLTFWQSEFVRLRLQYQHVERDFAGPQGLDDDDRVWLQVTFAAGPHKHEAY